MLSVVLYIVSFLFVGYISNHFNGEKVQIQIQFWLCFLLLFVFFGFRDLSVLNDTAHYYRDMRDMMSTVSFDATPWYHIDLHARFEAGYQIFMRLIGLYISRDPYSLIIITSLITTISILLFLKKFTLHISSCVFALLTTTCLEMQYCAFRQSLAISMSYLLCHFLQNGKVFKAVLCGVVAYFFHHSAIILFLPFILYHLPFSKKNVLILILVALSLSICIHSFLAIWGLDSNLYHEVSDNRTAPPIAAFFNLLFVVISLLIYFHAKKNYGQECTHDKLFESFAMSSLFVNIISISYLILLRDDLYFFPYVIVLLVNSLFALSNKRTCVYLLFLILLIRILLVLEYRNEWFHLIPYSFFDFNLRFHNTFLGY
jgi:hypothetical protein